MLYRSSLLVAAGALGAATAHAQAPQYFAMPNGIVLTDVSTAGGQVVAVGYSTITGQAVLWTPTGGVVHIGSTSGVSGANVRISRDGTTIVGEQDVAGISSTAYTTNNGATWTPIPGIGGSQGGFSTITNGVSSNGTIIVGLGYAAGNQAHPYKFTLGSGTVDLQPFFNSPQSRAFGVSGDGAMAVGWEASGGPRLGARWVGGVKTLFQYNGSSVGEAYAANQDASIVVGGKIYSGGTDAWRWDAGTGQITLLPNLVGATTSAYGIDLTDDGSKILGNNGGAIPFGTYLPVIWINGVPQELSSYLTSLGTLNLGSVTLPQAISPEGGAIVGGLGAGWAVVFPQFLPNGTAYCPGDGSGTACPCANNSPLGEGSGCLSSIGTGGKLRGGGASSVAADSLTLFSTQVPNGPALYFQGDAQQSGGAGLSFGDGLLCAGGTIIRLGVSFSTGNNSSVFPSAPGNPSISSLGLVAPGDVRHYQAWYRDAFVFCTLSTFNLSNGLTVNWTN